VNGRLGKWISEYEARQLKKAGMGFCVTTHPAAVRFVGWQLHPLDIAHNENKILSSWENQFFGLSRLL
jgi:hypothetical protein